MNKSELIGFIASKTGLKKIESESALEAVLEGIINALNNKEEVRLVGFGTFSVKHRPATEGRNPKTGEPIVIKEKYVAKFQPSKNLKDSLESIK